MPSIAKLKGTEDYKSWAFGMMLWLKKNVRVMLITPYQLQSGRSKLMKELYATSD
jgi:hypothetical protein